MQQSINFGRSESVSERKQNEKTQNFNHIFLLEKCIKIPAIGMRLPPIGMYSLTTKIIKLRVLVTVLSIFKSDFKLICLGRRNERAERKLEICCVYVVMCMSYA